MDDDKERLVNGPLALVMVVIYLILATIGFYHVAVWVIETLT